MRGCGWAKATARILYSNPFPLPPHDLPVPFSPSDESYIVTDYSLRDQLLVESCEEELATSPGRGGSGMLHSRLGSVHRLFTLTMLSNHAGERVQLLLRAETL